jgi:hypothetical protein
MKLDTFPLLSRLPVEIRLMVWEETWPESRVIEAAYAEVSVASQLEGGRVRGGIILASGIEGRRRSIKVNINIVTLTCHHITG